MALIQIPLPIILEILETKIEEIEDDGFPEGCGWTPYTPKKLELKICTCGCGSGYCIYNDQWYNKEQIMNLEK
jgi:hypothetical protein